MEKSSGASDRGISRRKFIKTSAALSVATVASQTALFGAESHTFRAGAAAIDITPIELPVRVLGGFLEATADSIAERIHARSIALDDGRMRIAIVVVDSCMVPRELIDEAKDIAAQRTGIGTDRILVASTHTHSAPAAMDGLGTRADEKYPAFLVPKIADAVEAAVKNLVPAKIGWAAVDVPEYTHCRRWVLRSDKMRNDPFGERTVHAHMHPGYRNPDFVGPAGPVDTGFTVLAVKSLAGRPIAVMGNYSQHYKGAAPISGDYYARFARMIEETVTTADNEPPVVGIMSQGTSGDLHWMDYSKPAKNVGLDEYAKALADIAHEEYTRIKYNDWVPLAMVERKIKFRRRTPDAKRLTWAEKVKAQIQGPIARSQPEVYALEAIYMHEEPVRELKLQALRIGDLGICAIPNEVFGITGVKLKEQSPFPTQFNMELANGAEGYIPPPFQHRLGGYTTWPARTAGLEEQAEPVITENLLEMLEELSGRSRRKVVEPKGACAQAVLAAKPLAYWRMNEYAGPAALDCTGNGNNGEYEGLVAFYLTGPQGEMFSGDKINRCALFAGGRLRARLSGLGDHYTLSLWFWNGFPPDARQTTGYLFSRGPSALQSDSLGIGGNAGPQGRLFFSNGGGGERVVFEGKTEIPMRTWTNVVLVRQAESVRIYLDGQLETSGESPIRYSPRFETLYVGGREGEECCFEGKIDEVALYCRALTGEEIGALCLPLQSRATIAATNSPTIRGG
ncbi:MAG: neutral/alkaline non-lysosomal ceramidase N-terminal domain-containing protein [Phycisphaerales bacterium]|nr:MAG: neutral/alkaline non-lysosomal ceramidase N-terminal domain-containing protein [Phycisphaerales bacterium]